MNKSLYNIFSRLAIAVTLVLAALLITSPVAANEAQQINTGSINPREPDFFRAGREKFENEIKRLIIKSTIVKQNTLQISPDAMQIQQQLLPLEKHQVVPGKVESDDSQKLMNQDSKIMP